MPLKIDEEIAGLIPPLLADERAQLEVNLLRDGCTDALKVWRHGGDDVLLDGHNRLEICESNDIPYQSVAVPSVASLDDAKRWVILNQFGRRNLQPYQRAELALKLKPLLAEKAKETQGKRTDLLPKSAKGSPRDTREDLARIAGVGHDTIHKAEVIAEKADEETKAALRRGDKGVSINRAYKEVTGKKEKPPLKHTETHPVSDAMTFAEMAISQLERIASDDPKRAEAIARVHEWIHDKGGIDDE